MINCKNWKTAFKGENFTSSFSKNIVLDVDKENDYRIISINPQTQKFDTIRTPCRSPMQVIAGEDIIGIWNDRRADYFRIVKDTAVFLSRIKYDMIWTSHVPMEIYQHGDIVYSSVLVPSVESNIKCSFQRTMQNPGRRLTRKAQWIKNMTGFGLQ